MTKSGRETRTGRGEAFGVPPAVAGTLDHAVAQAERDIRSECAGARSPMTQSCSLIQQAELHAYPRDAGDRVGVPLWTISFGQHPRWADDVSRVVDPVTGQGEVLAHARDRSAPTGEIEFLDAKIAALRFFEADPAGRAPRRFARQFSPAAREVGWTLELKHDPPGRWIALPIEAVLFHVEGGGERLLQRKLLHTAVSAEWANTSHSDEFGWENPYYYDRSGAATPSPGRWQPGTYRVDLFVGARGRSAYKFATGTFEIR